MGKPAATDRPPLLSLSHSFTLDFVNHAKKEYARGDVHENRAECPFSLLKPYLRVFRGLSKTNLPGYLARIIHEGQTRSWDSLPDVL